METSAPSSPTAGSHPQADPRHRVPLRQARGSVPPLRRLDADANPTGEISRAWTSSTGTYWDPRFGFAWKPSGDGRTVLRGSIGRLPRGHPRRRLVLACARHAATFYCHRLNPGTGEWEVLGNSLRHPTPHSSTGTQSRLQHGVHPRLEHQVAATSSAGVQAVYKKTDDAMGWYILDDAEYRNVHLDRPRTGRGVPAQGLRGGRPDSDEGQQLRARVDGR